MLQRCFRGRDGVLMVLQWPQGAAVPTSHAVPGRGLTWVPHGCDFLGSPHAPPSPPLKQRLAASCRSPSLPLPSSRCGAAAQPGRSGVGPRGRSLNQPSPQSPPAVSPALRPIDRGHRCKRTLTPTPASTAPLHEVAPAGPETVTAGPRRKLPASLPSPLNRSTGPDVGPAISDIAQSRQKCHIFSRCQETPEC